MDTDDDVRLARRIQRDVTSRGRDVAGVIGQYTKFVKPAFDTFIGPSRWAAAGKGCLAHCVSLGVPHAEHAHAEHEHCAALSCTNGAQPCLHGRAWFQELFLHRSTPSTAALALTSSALPGTLLTTASAPALLPAAAGATPT